MNRNLMVIVLVLSALALSACPAGTPNTPGRTPMPTPVIVVTTTAKQLDTSAVATHTSSTIFDIPDGKYLLLSVVESERGCYYRSNCPAEPGDRDQRSLSEQGQAMREMIREGAKGFVHVTWDYEYITESCSGHAALLEPVTQLPYSILWHGHSSGRMVLHRVNRDGTVIATIGETTYILRPGDEWSSRYEITSTPDSIHVCWLDTDTLIHSLRNEGLMEVSQIPALSAPPPTPIPPTPTALPQESIRIAPQNIIGREG